jgi:hypothetical protein
MNVSDEVRQGAKKQADAVQEYITNPGRVIANAFQRDDKPLSDGGFILLQLTMSMLEYLGEWKCGAVGDKKIEREDKRLDRASNSLFESGFLHVHPEYDTTDSEDLYSLIRCGLMHSVFPKGAIRLSRDFAYGLCIQGGPSKWFEVNPAIWFELVQGKLVGFLSRIACGLGTEEEVECVARRLHILELTPSRLPTTTSQTPSTGTTSAHETTKVPTASTTCSCESPVSEVVSPPSENQECPPLPVLFPGMAPSQFLHGCWVYPSSGTNCE